MTIESTLRVKGKIYNKSI